MPPSKKQKTSDNSSVTTRKDNSDSKPHTQDKEHRDLENIPDYEYVCIHRPHFDWEAERRAAENDNEIEEDDKFRKLMVEEESSGKIFEPAAENKEWKWVMLWEGWKKFCDLTRTIIFCDPDNFGMYIYNDWKGYGVVEAVENYLNDFDRTFKKQDAENWLFRAWAIVSCFACWLNNEIDGGMDMINIDDGDRANELIALVGYALLTVLAAIEHADELKPDSKFLDLPLVISAFLLWSNGLESYGFEGDAIFWRRHAVDYYTKAGLDPAKGIAGTAKLLEELKVDEDEGEDENEDTSGRSEKDPWGWGKRVKQYKKSQGTMGGSKYDIRMMTRKERAQYAFDKKDPLKDIPLKDIKEGNIGLA